MELNSEKGRIDTSQENEINPATISPEDLLRLIAHYSEPYMQGPIETVADGTFAGQGKLFIDEQRKVVLIRYALDKEHLIKDGKSAGAVELKEGSEFPGSREGTVHTCANRETFNTFSNYTTRGVFKIPVKDFVALARDGKLIIGNLGMCEIVLSGDVAQQYLVEVQTQESANTDDDIILPPDILK